MKKEYNVTYKIGKYGSEEQQTIYSEKALDAVDIFYESLSHQVRKHIVLIAVTEIIGVKA